MQPVCLLNPGPSPRTGFGCLWRGVCNAAAVVNNLFASSPDRSCRSKRGLPALALILVASEACAAFAHFEARHTHPIALTPDQRTLLALNSPDGRLSVFALSDHGLPVLQAEIAVGLEPVSVRARGNEEAWVVNEASDTVSIVSLRHRTVMATLACPDEPADVIFANDRAFVTCARNGLVRVFDPNTRTELAALPLRGVYPRALAARADGERIYAGFQLSGNQTTVLPASKAPPPPAPTRSQLPPAPQTALIVPANDPRVAYTVRDHDVAEIITDTLEVSRHFSGVGTSLFALAFRPGTDELWVANTEAFNLTRFEPALKGRFAGNRLTRLTVGDGGVTPFDLNPDSDPARVPNPAAQALAQPMAVVFSADGSQAWVAAFASDRVARWDAAEARVTARVDLRVSATDDARRMRGPRGLALHEGLHRLYVLNKLAGSISVIDSGPAAWMAEVPVGSHDPTPGKVKEGRGFLFDARLSGNGTVSCATCHIDADRDGLAWDLGDPEGVMTTVIGANLAIHDATPQPRPMHPMKGPMMTQTLRGLAPRQLLHWRGDRATLHDFNPTFRDLLGGSLIADADIDLLQAYLDSLRHHPNPHRTLDNAAPALLNGGNPARGRSLFNTHLHHCAVCHTLPAGSDNNVDDARNIGTAQFVKTPPLQTVYQRALLNTRAGAENLSGFGLLHDGTGGSQSLPTVHFYELDLLRGVDFADVTAFVLSFETGTAPSVGYQRTWSGAQRNDPQADAEMALMEMRARLNECDLIAHGRAGGREHRLFFDVNTRRYRSDWSGEAPRTRAQVFNLLGPGDALTFRGTLPGRGLQSSIDRDGNGVPDAEEPPALLSISRAGNTLRLLSPSMNRGWALEQSSSLQGPWEPAPMTDSSNAREWSWDILPDRRETFFRLRRTW